MSQDINTLLKDAKVVGLDEGPQQDPLAVQVDLMPELSAKIGILEGQLILSQKVGGAIEERARALLAEKDQRIAELEAMMPKDEPDDG